MQQYSLVLKSLSFVYVHISNICNEQVTNGTYTALLFTTTLQPWNLSQHCVHLAKDNARFSQACCKVSFMGKQKYATIIITK